MSHRGISLRDFASLSNYQSSACWCALLLPGLWTLTSHNLSNCFSFIGLDFDFFFPRQYLSKCREAAWMQMFRPEASLPHKATENVDSFADSSQETHRSPLPTPVLTLASGGAHVWGREVWLGCSLCPPLRRMSFLGPELMPVLVHTPYSSKEQHNNEHQ